MKRITSNLKHWCKIDGRIKVPKNFRSRSRGSPLRGDYLLKSGNFWYFGGRIPSPWADWGEILHSQVDPGARRPYKVWPESVQRVATAGRKPWFLAVSKFNTDSLPLGGIVPVTTTVSRPHTPLLSNEYQRSIALRITTVHQVLRRNCYLTGLDLTF